MKRWLFLTLALSALAMPTQAHAFGFNCNFGCYFSPPPMCPMPCPCPIGYWTCTYQPTVCYVPQWKSEPVVVEVPKLHWKAERAKQKVAGYVPKQVNEKKLVYSVRYEPKVVGGCITYDVITEPKTVVVPTIQYEPEIREIDTIKWVPEWRNEKVVTYRYTVDYVAVPTVKPTYAFMAGPAYQDFPTCAFGW